MILCAVLILGGHRRSACCRSPSPRPPSWCPLAYLVYIYDVNLWEEAPVPVVVGLFVGTGALAVLVSLFFFDWVFDDQWSSFVGGGRARGGIELAVVPGAADLRGRCCRSWPRSPRTSSRVLLAARPQFDDMIDGLTFGIAAGTAYAAFETIVVYSSVFTSGDFRTTTGSPRGWSSWST